ncbi:hypothetical protein D3C84_645120 [compost metagenome]
MLQASRVGPARIFGFAVEVQAAIGPVNQPKPRGVGCGGPMLDQRKLALDPRPVAHHLVLASQWPAVVGGFGSGNQRAIFSALGHPHVTARSHHLVAAVIGWHPLGGAQGDGIGRHPPADSERAVAHIAAVAQPQCRGKAAAGGNRQGQLQRCRTVGAHRAPPLADALDGAAAFGQGGGIDLHQRLLLFIHSEPPSRLAV